MPSNRGVDYLEPGSVEVQNIDFPTFRNPAGKRIDHGVILKVVTTNNVAPTSTWSGAARRRRPVWCSDTRSPAK
jgi:hypothetical protein